MASEPASRRAALYVDFDNVFMALLRWDERAAYAFGEHPDAWLAWLEREESAEAKRRILVRRCYLNPGRYLDFPVHGPVAGYRATMDKRNRLHFSEFRASFVQAGFDVVDCPPVASLKNAADMKMALDIREALDHPTRFDEFILLSGDSDFLPALTRLRAHDRRITILAQDTAKQAYLAAADTVVGLNEFANHGMGALPIATFELAPPPTRERLSAPPPAIRRPEAPPDQREAVAAWLRETLARAPSGAILMTTIGEGLRRAFPSLKDTNYAGAGTLGRLIEEFGDAGLALHGPSHQRWLYDPRRSEPPAPTATAAPEPPETTATEAVPTETVATEPGPATTPLAEAELREPEDATAPPEEAYAVLAEPEATPSVPWSAPMPDDQPSLGPPPIPVIPEPEPTPAAIPPAMAEPTRVADMAETVARLRDLLWGRRDIKDFPLDLPAFDDAEIGFVLSAIARRSPFGPMQLETAARDIAAEGARRNLLVSPREVVAIIRWLLRGKASFRDAMPASAALSLAEILYDQLGRAVERIAAQRSTAPRPEERFDAADWAAIEAWLTTGLRRD